jgi:deoxyribonuclease-1
MYEDNNKQFFIILLILFAFAAILGLLSFNATSHAAGQAEGWKDTKDVLYKVIYKDHNIDLYYGCKYKDITHVDLSTCDLPPATAEKARAHWIEAEHIVPASLQPAHEFACWREGRRKECEQNDPRAQAMIYDLHNLAPAIGQVNADRGNKRYGEKADDHTFVPNDCVKGDVARTWLYMHDQYGVVLLPGEEDMFKRWSANDPVSPWEAEREKRVKKYTFVDNPYVKGQTPDLKGACPWEKLSGVL